MGKNKQYTIIFVVITVVIIASVLVLFPPPRSFEVSDVSGPVSDSSWRSIPFRDVMTGELHAMSDYSVSPVIIQTFTVTCPICTRQQQEITSLKKELGDDAFTYIALDIDPDEPEDVIRSHVLRNGFDGIYAASPVTLSRALLDEFGPDIISPASAPIVLICPDGRSGKLPSGIKTSGYLKEALDQVC